MKLRLFHIEHAQRLGAVVAVLQEFVSYLIKSELVLDNGLDVLHVNLEFFNLVSENEFGLAQLVDHCVIGICVHSRKCNYI